MKRAWKLSCYFSKTATEENAVLITWRLSWHWEPTVSTELRYICKWSARVDLNHWLFRSKRSTLTRLRYWLIVCCATRFEPCISNLLIGVLKLFRRSTNHNDLQAAFASCKSADGLMCYFTSPSRRTFLRCLLLQHHEKMSLSHSIIAFTMISNRSFNVSSNQFSKISWSINQH